MQEQLITHGILLRTKQGLVVPKEIVNGKDRIYIEITDREQKLFTLYVSEDIDSSGGGRLGEILDQLHQERAGRPYPCSGYDKDLKADIYRIYLMDLLKVWTMYLGRDKKPITEAQLKARRENMAKARKARKT